MVGSTQPKEPKGCKCACSHAATYGYSFVYKKVTSSIVLDKSTEFLNTFYLNISKILFNKKMEYKSWVNK